ncbi:MAG TPA: hypothetical protein VK524_34425 [Polyangiaceae bacterium]|nr:hypothetical protein [Polyangiaceae bacterium]
MSIVQGWSARALRTLPLCIALALFAACTQPGPSLVSQGQRYHVANAEFDAYFAKLYALHAEVEGAFAKEAEVRKKLSEVLGEEQEASSSLISKNVRRRAQTLAHSGVYLRFELEDDDETSAQAEIVVSGRRPADNVEEFLKALSGAARDELKLTLAMLRARRELEELRFQTTRLDKRVDDAFRQSGPRKKAEVRSNLEDSLALIPVLIVRADELQQDAEKLLDKLIDSVRVDAPPMAGAVNISSEGATSARGQPMAEPAERAGATTEPPAGERKGRRARGAARRPAAAAKPPAPAAAPKPPKPAAPKPAPAPAADFEP